MVLTVTLNPVLEQRLYFKEIKTGTVNRSSGMKYLAGGKGINVSRQLNHLGIENSAIALTGGFTGKKLKELAERENIKLISMNIQQETRTGTIIYNLKENSKETYFSPAPAVTHTEITDIISRLEKAVKISAITVFSGSSPSIETSEIFASGIEMSHRYDRISILDTYGEHLSRLINLAPTIIHINLNEAESSLNIRLKNENDITGLLKFLYSKNIKQVFLTDGPNLFYSSSFDYIYKITPPEVNCTDSTGSGDAFTAGVAYGLEKSLPFIDYLKLSAALGAANAETENTCSVMLQDARELTDKIKIETVGKKIFSSDV